MDLSSIIVLYESLSTLGFSADSAPCMLFRASWAVRWPSNLLAHPFVEGCWCALLAALHAGKIAPNHDLQVVRCFIPRIFVEPILGPETQGRPRKQNARLLVRVKLHKGTLPEIIEKMSFCFLRLGSRTSPSRYSR